jgi:hypothetical protein
MLTEEIIMDTPVDLKQPTRARWCAVPVCYSFFLLAGILLAGCGSTALFKQSQRATYDIQEKDLRKLQFYIGTEVIAQPVEKHGSSNGNVLILPADTPGLVKEVGPNWLRVAFQPGGSGVIFLAYNGSEYVLGTAVAGRSGFYPLKDLPDNILLHEGRRYSIVRGLGARLWVNQKDFEELIKQRQHIGGLKR